jgi:hypothetical protein
MKGINGYDERELNIFIEKTGHKIDRLDRWSLKIDKPFDALNEWADSLTAWMAQQETRYKDNNERLIGINEKLIDIYEGMIDIDESMETINEINKNKRKNNNKIN